MASGDTVKYITVSPYVSSSVKDLDAKVLSQNDRKTQNRIAQTENRTEHAKNL